MPDAATLAVLQDVIYIAFVALLVGAGAYAVTRAMSPVTGWNYAGQVESRPYEWQDAIVAVLLTLLVTSSIIMASPGSEAKTSSDTGVSASESSQIAGVAMAMFWDLMLVALILGFLRVLRDGDPAELFGLRRLSLKQALIKAVIWIIPAWLVVWGVEAVSSSMLEGVWPNADPQSSVQLLEGTQSVSVKLLMSVMAVVAAPLAEELLFRGFLFGVIKRYTDTYFAALLSGLLFASVHAHVGTFLPLFALGISFTMAYEATGCLLVPIFMHALFNGSQVTMMLLGKD